MDFFLIETMSDMAEVEAAIAGAQRGSTRPRDHRNHELRHQSAHHDGVSPAAAISRIADLGIAGAGGNCGRGPEEMEAIMTEMATGRPDGPLLVAQSNAGLPHLHGDSFVYDVEPEQMADHARAAARHGRRRDWPGAAGRPRGTCVSDSRPTALSDST